jgi:hypothetical protein
LYTFLIFPMRTIYSSYCIFLYLITIISGEQLNASLSNFLL